MIDELNRKFGLPGVASFAPGRNGLPRLELRHGSGASLQVYLHGAHVTSWRRPDGREMLFTSGQSEFADGRPIRGGIPVVFPQFGDGPLPKHGFARIRTWRPEFVRVAPGGALEARLVLDDDAGTYAMWPHRFRLALDVALSDVLTVRVSVRNAGGAPFSFLAALHTYFAVDDIACATVLGLKGLPFIDTVGDGRKPGTDGCEAIAFDRETDRVYARAPARVALRDEAARFTLALDSEGMRDIVVWNPWVEKSKRMPDFGDDEYRRMVCVETGVVAEGIDLPPDGLWTGATTFRVE